MDVLYSACQEELVRKHARPLLEKRTGLNHLLGADAHDDLARLYQLFSRVPTDLDMVAEMLKVFVNKEGREILKAETQGNELVRKLITLHARFSVCVFCPFRLCKTRTCRI